MDDAGIFAGGLHHSEQRTIPGQTLYGNAELTTEYQDTFREESSKFHLTAQNSRNFYGSVEDQEVGTQRNCGQHRTAEATNYRKSNNGNQKETNGTEIMECGGKDTGLSRTMEHSVQKQSQIATTLKWLTDNYERAEGVCLPRCVLYTHYLDLCKTRKFTPAGAATFGKIIRQRFPRLTTRRLGTRGQSKYHYYGIGIKVTSAYYHAVYTGKGLTRFSGTKVRTEGSSRKYSLSSKTGTLLPEFPDGETLVLPKDVDREKVLTFLMMYRTHCQRILDTVISANFEEVQSFLLHFWQGMPEHLVSLLSHDFMSDVIGLCDAVLYKVLVDVLIPSTIQDLPESLGLEIKHFIRNFPVWLCSSMENVPETIQKKKREVLSTLVKNIRRQVSFIHVAQTSRSALNCSDTVSKMLHDLERLDIDRICQQTGFTDPRVSPKVVRHCFHELKSLLTKQSPVELFTEWLDNVIDSLVFRNKQEDEVKVKAAEFLLQWTVVGSLIMRDLTLSNAASFGSLHLLHIMLDEYVLLVMETQSSVLKDRELREAVQRHTVTKGAETVKTSKKSSKATTKSQVRVNKKRKFVETGIPAADESADDQVTKKVQSDDRDKQAERSTAFSKVETNKNNHPPSSIPSSLPTYLPLQETPLSPTKHPQMENSSYYSHYYHHHARLPEVRNLTSSTGYNMASASPSGQPYWNDTATRAYDHSGSYGAFPCYNSLSYDVYGHPGHSLFSRSQDSYGFGSTVLDGSPGYYGRHSEAAVSPYPDFSTPGPPAPCQYARPEPLFAAPPPAQDPLCSAGFTTPFGHTFAKSLVSSLR